MTYNEILSAATDKYHSDWSDARAIRAKAIEPAEAAYRDAVDRAYTTYVKTMAEAREREGH